MLRMRTIVRHRGMVWLALVMSLMTAGDLVMDLAFEEAEPVTSAEASSIPEAPENAAEHVLMPSQKADHSTATTWLILPPSVVHSALVTACLPPPVIARADFARERPPRRSPVPLLLPLRI